jgi:hypothetical protein
LSALAERAVQQRPRRRERCSSCGTAGRFGQLICLGCGERMALKPRGGPNRRPVLAVAAILVAVGAAAAVMIVEGVDGGAPAATPIERPAAIDRAAVARAEARARELRRAERRARRARLAAAAGAWPAGRDGYTVVLSNTGDRGSAEAFARTVSDGGVKAGVIDANEHANLGSDLFLVFAGVYGDEAKAAATAARLAETYPGAYPQYVQAATGASSGRPAQQRSP